MQVSVSGGEGRCANECVSGEREGGKCVGVSERVCK